MYDIHVYEAVFDRVKNEKMTAINVDARLVHYSAHIISFCKTILNGMLCSAVVAMFNRPSCIG